jgi:hypothetical protein
LSILRRYCVGAIAVAHRRFRHLGTEALHALSRRNHVLNDVKHISPASEVDGRQYGLLARRTMMDAEG